MKFFPSLVLSALLIGCAPTAPQIYHADLIQIHSSSVFVKTKDGNSGSGSIFRAASGELLILTAAHVVRDDPEVPAIISQSILKNGQKIGEYATFADIVAISLPGSGFDIAVLKPRDTIFTNTISFYKGASVPMPGTPIIHCGSPDGSWLERSLTFGHVAGLNRRRTALQPNALDQSTCTVLPGSSGGGLFLATTGEFIGFVSQWEGFDNVNFFVPVRDILGFLRAEKLLE